MENNQKQHQSHFGTAFVLGLVIGAGIALLFATKKGRRILKALTEEGLDNIPDLKKYFRSTVNEFTDDDDEEKGESEYIEEKIRVADMPRHNTTRIHVDEEPERHVEAKENGSVKKHSPVKRFFRGVPKKS
ncbi:MAG: YtxH domain-containing protein [Candidatus Levybacteria bacterium]|nr:YtxH domain-containing protein [Candidatus Levybacteria bacterium]